MDNLSTWDTTSVATLQKWKLHHATSWLVLRQCWMKVQNWRNFLSLARKMNIVLLEGVKWTSYPPLRTTSHFKPHILHILKIRKSAYFAFAPLMISCKFHQVKAQSVINKTFPVCEISKETMTTVESWKYQQDPPFSAF